MFRRLSPAIVAAALFLVACGGTTAPGLTDPKEILAKSLDALQGMKSVHFKASVSGALPLDLTGQGSASSFDLTGTNADGDFDIAGQRIEATFGVPSLLGTGGELIAIGPDLYVKLTGPMATGDKYMHSAGGGTSGSALAIDPIKALADVRAGLDRLSTPPTKGGDQKCGDQDCYTVSVKLGTGDLGGLGGAGDSSVGGPGGSGALRGLTSIAPGLAGGANLDVLARKSDLRPARLVISVATAAQSPLSVSIDLSDYDAGVSIQAPPSDQVTEGGLDKLIP